MGLRQRWREWALGPEMEPRETRRYLLEPRNPDAKALVEAIATVFAAIAIVIFLWR